MRSTGDGVFAGGKAFHVSGITPALSKNCCEVTMDALKKAKEHGLFVSYDLNYRKNLWSTAEAAAAQEPMMAYVGPAHQPPRTTPTRSSATPGPPPRSARNSRSASATPPSP